jgi:hypothetical protein
VTASNADAIVATTIGLFIFVALVTAWRVLIHDRSIRRIRMGVFYEREHEDEKRDPWERPPELPPEPEEEPP